MRSPQELAAGVLRHLRRMMIRISQLVLFWFRYHDFGLLERFDRGFAENPSIEVGEDPNVEGILKRVVAAFERAKYDQRLVPGQYAVGPMWEGVISRNFGELLAAISAPDSSKATQLLESFHRCKCALAAGGSYDDYIAYRRSSLYRYQFINTWMRYVALYQRIGGKEGELSFSQVGRPVGLTTLGGIIPLEAVRYHYWSRRFFSLLDDRSNPVICEIGGGLGGQAYKVLENAAKGTRYMIFDIPETLLVASYFLLRSLPGRKVLLYGEGDLDAEALEQCDLVLMPNFELPKLPTRSVDLWFNSCSFSEMLRETAQEYLRQIERTSRGFFLHVNHTIHFRWEVDGIAYENLPADQLVPDPRYFELVENRPRLFGRIEDRVYLRRHKARHEVHLYRGRL